MNSTLLVILGPTASGKTRLGVELARSLGGEIISADSRQVYRGMDIGSGKDLIEYGEVPYHLIDIVEPGYEFNVFEFQRRFLEAFAAIVRRGRLPVLVGGTGLYLDAVLNRYRMVAVPEDSILRDTLAGQPLEILVSRLRTGNQRLHNTTDLLDRERLIRAIEIAEYEESHPRSRCRISNRSSSASVGNGQRCGSGSPPGCVSVSAQGSWRRWHGSMPRVSPGNVWSFMVWNTVMWRRPSRVS